MRAWAAWQKRPVRPSQENLIKLARHIAQHTCLPHGNDDKRTIGEAENGQQTALQIKGLLFATVICETIPDAPGPTVASPLYHVAGSATVIPIVDGKEQGGGDRMCHKKRCSNETGEIWDLPMYEDSASLIGLTEVMASIRRAGL